MKGTSINLDDSILTRLDNGQAEVYLTKMIALTRHSYLKIKKGKQLSRKEFANFIGRVLYLAYARDIIGNYKQYADVRFTKNTVEIRTVYPSDKK